MYRIIYPNDITISIIVPSPNSDLSIHELAQKYVPYNVPYKIVLSTEIPEDRTFRNAWTANFDNPDGYGGNINL